MNIIQVGRDLSGIRIDRVLRRELTSCALATIYQMIRTGKIKVNGKRTKQNYRLCEGDSVAIDLKDNVQRSNSGTPLPPPIMNTPLFKHAFRLLYEDEVLLVCNKPSGVVVHPGKGHERRNTLIDCASSYIYHTASKKTFSEPHLVHRLDKETSGVILIAKDMQTLRKIHEQLRSGKLEKKYRALCHGKPPAKNDTVNVPLVRTHQASRGMKMHVKHGGQESVSGYTVLGTTEKVSHLSIVLHTGRTHQIRVHMAHLQCPLIGDTRYGDSRKDQYLFLQKNVFQRLYLHAEIISFFHPLLKKKVTFHAPIPDEFTALLTQFF